MCVFHPTWVSPGGTRNWGSGVFICAAYAIGECATTAGSHRFEPPVSRLTPPVPSAIHNFTYFRLLAIRLLNHEQGALATRSQERCRQIRKWQYVPQLLNCCFGLGEVLLAICAWSGSGLRLEEQSTGAQRAIDEFTYALLRKSSSFLFRSLWSGK
jgi:hypothetical protein